MSIISSMRRQKAIYWPPATTNDYGEPTYGTLVELVLVGSSNYRVRWEDSVIEYKDSQGDTRQSQALVYVPALPGGGEVAIGGWLWLGNRADLASEADPTANPNAYTVRRVDRLPTMKANETLRTAYL